MTVLGGDGTFSIKLILLDTYRDFCRLFLPVIRWSGLVLVVAVLCLFATLYDSADFQTMSEIGFLLVYFLAVFPPMIFVLRRLLVDKADRHSYLQSLLRTPLWKSFSYWILIKIFHFAGYMLLAMFMVGVSSSIGMPLIGSPYQREVLVLTSGIVGVWIWVKFVCVIPLMISGEQGPIRTSWRLAKGYAFKLAICYCASGLIIWSTVVALALGLLLILQVGAPLLMSSLVLYSTVLGSSFYLIILFLTTSSTILEVNVYRTLVRLQS